MSMASRTGLRHLLNTVAGSIFVTLTIADSAEMAHMPTVSVNNQNARPGVMTIGRAVFLLSHEHAQRDGDAEQVADHRADTGLRQDNLVNISRR